MYNIYGMNRAIATLTHRISSIEIQMDKLERVCPPKKEACTCPYKLDGYNSCNYYELGNTCTYHSEEEPKPECKHRDSFNSYKTYKEYKFCPKCGDGLG